MTVTATLTLPRAAIKFPVPSPGAQTELPLELGVNYVTAQLVALVADLRPDAHRLLPNARVKERVIAQLTAALQDALTDQLLRRTHLTPEQTTRYRPELRRAVQAQVIAYLGNWTQIDPVAAYRFLLQSPDLLPQLGREVLDPTSLDLLRLDAPAADAPLRAADLGPLLYLVSLLEGVPPSRQFDHIVVDEGQDVSLVEFEVLKRWSRNVSFTILGDMAQSIFAHHGLESWDDLTAIFGAARITQHLLHRSYRSTRPIIAYANRMLTRADAPAAGLAQPVGRPGPEVEEHRFATHPAQAAWIADQVRGRQAGTLAVITRSSRAAVTLAR